MGRIFNKAALRPFGYEIHRFYDAFSGLRLLPAIKTVIDVGVDAGTPDLYKYCPDAELLLFEPNAKCADVINDKVLSCRKGRLYPFGLGSENTTLLLNVDGPRSPFFERTGLTKPEGKRYETVEVKVRRLDEVLCKEDLAGPVLLKVDTEGYELKVLEGAVNLFPYIDLIFVEASVLKRFHDSYTFYELMSFLRTNGFDIFQVLTANKDKRGLIRFMDILFAKEAFLAEWAGGGDYYERRVHGVD